MLPGNTLSTSIEVSPFLSPRNVLYSGLQDYEEGGIALNNTSAGLQYQVWHAFVDSTLAGNIYLEAPNTPANIVFTAPGITDISLTFDQNMNIFLAYTQSGQAKIRWFDPLIPGYTVTNLEVTAITPKASLDDKRAMAIQLGGTDIIVGYIYNNALCMRMQRDRYGILYTLLTPLSAFLAAPSLRNVGMNTNNRFQFFLQAAFTV